MKRKGSYFAMPSLVGFSLFYIIPFVFSLYYAFIDNTFSKAFVGFKNFEKLLSNKYYLLALRNTFEFSLVAVPCMLAVAFFLAVICLKMGDRLPVLKVVLVLPVLIPSSAVVPIWRELLVNSERIIDALTTLDPSGTLAVRLPVYLLYIWKNAGFIMILLLAGLRNLPSEVFESAAIDGVTTLKKHWYITLPLLWPSLFFSGIMSLIYALRIFKEIYLLYGSYPPEPLYMMQNYMNNHFFKLNYQYLTTGAIIFAVITAVIVLAAYKADRRSAEVGI